MKISSKKIFARWIIYNAIGIAIVFSICMVVIVLSMRTTESEIDHVQQVSLDQVRQNVDANLRAIETLVYRYTVDEEIRKLLRKSIDFQIHRTSKIWEIQRRLESLSFSNALIRQCMIYVTEENYLLQTNMKSATDLYYDFSFPYDSVSYEQWMALLRNQASKSYHLLTIGKEAAAASILYMQAVKALSDNHVIGKLVLILNGLEIKKLLTNAKWTPKSEIIVVDEANHLVCSTSDTPIVSDRDIVRIVSTIDATAVRSHEKTYITNFVASDVNGWRYISLIEKGVFYASIKKAQVWISSLLVFCVCVSIVIAYIIARHNYTPLDWIIKTLVQHGKARVGGIRELTTVQHVIAQVLDENETTGELLNQQGNLLKRYFLGRLLSESFENDIVPIDVRLKSNGIQFHYSDFTVLLIQIGQGFLITEDAREYSSITYIERTFVRLFREMSTEIDVWNTNTSKHLSFIMNHPDTSETEELIRDIVKKAMNVCAEENNAKLFVGISKSHSGIERLRRGYDEAIIALECNQNGNGAAIQFFSSVEDVTHANPAHSALVFTKDMHYYVSARKFKLARKCLWDFYHDAVCEKGISERIRSSRRHILIHTLLETEKLVSESTDGDVFDAIQAEKRLYSCDNDDLTFIESLRILADLEAYVVGRSTSRENGAVTEQAMKIIRTNIDDFNLNVSTVADKIGVSIASLSRSFKKNAGVNPLDYINRLRVETAKKLLVESRSSVEKVAYDVGYRNSLSLIRIFKKYEGTTPGRYKALQERR